MAQRLPVLYNKKPCYDIVFQQSFDGLWEELQELGASEKKLCIVTDSRVDELYGAQVAELLEGKCRKIVKYAFPAGEENKNLETVKDVYRYLIEEGFDRKDMLLALGGGVTGDLTGFVAATYLRGIDFVQIPTTLLAQVDSSIGGKTGVDFDSYKNMVGAFKMPRLVYMNLSVLKTLEERQFYSGFAEVMKSALIKDALFYEWLIESMYEICEREPATLSKHTGKLLHALLLRQSADRRDCRLILHRFLNQIMGIRHRRNLREMCDTDNLVRPSQHVHLLGNHLRRPAADSAVDLIKNQRPHRILIR